MSTIWGFLSVLPLFLTQLGVFLHLQKKVPWSNTGRFILALCLWALILFGVTELLGSFTSLTYYPLLISWSLIAAALLLSARQQIQPAIHQLYETCRHFLSQKKSPAFFILILTILTVTLLTAMLAWIFPPNTWDSMTYHMSRVPHWQQNASVDFYPTAILRQLHSNPLAEYFILNLNILYGSDQLANFVQWLAALGAMFNSYAICRLLGGSRKTALLSAFFCCTMPMFILQMSSTQNDLCTAFWLSAFIYFCILFAKKPQSLPLWASGLALGLALLTKGSAYIYTAPFVAVLLLFVLISRNYKYLIIFSASMILAVLVNAPHYYRNFELYGKVLGPTSEVPGYSLTNESFSPLSLASNIIRNLSLQIGLTEKTNAVLVDQVTKLHHLMGVDLNNPQTTWPSQFELARIRKPNEDTAVNPLHFLIIMGAMIWVFLFSRNRPLVIYAATLLGSAIIFCLLLKWQPYHSRLHLPLFILAAPLAAIFIKQLPRLLSIILIVAMAGLTALPLFVSANKPIIDKDNIFSMARDDRMFMIRKNEKRKYINAVNILSEHQCFNIGLVSAVDDWEYPLWVMLQKKTQGKPHFTHINVTNISNRLDDHKNDQSICAIVAISPISGDQITFAGKNFKRSSDETALPVFISSP